MKTTLLTVAALIIGVIAGFFIGRRFPEHHYVSLMNDTPILYDTATGQACSSVPVVGNKFKQCGK